MGYTAAAAYILGYSAPVLIPVILLLLGLVIHSGWQDMKSLKEGRETMWAGPM